MVVGQLVSLVLRLRGGASGRWLFVSSGYIICSSCIGIHLSLHTPVSDFRAGDAPPYLHKEQVGFTERLDKV